MSDNPYRVYAYSEAHPQKKIKKVKPKTPPKVVSLPTRDMTFSQKVQNSRQWKALRRKAIEYYGRQCHKCGDSGYDVEIHVDHIKPKSKYPELAFDPNNLQVLCKDCNFDKGNTDETDYR